MREMIEVDVLLRLAAALLLCAACGTSASAPDAGTDAGPDGGGAAGASWSAPITIDPSPRAGFDLAFAVDPQGRPAVAYFRDNFFLDGGPSNNDELVVARETAPGTWTSEVVPAALDGGSLTGHYGLGLAFDPGGNPAVAYLGGESPDTKTPIDHRWHDLLTGVPLPSDSVVARRGASGWQRTTLGQYSNSFVSTSCKTDGTCPVDNQGSTIGLWSALAFSPDGALHVVQRDVHFGSDQSATDASNLEYGKFTASAQTVGEAITSRVSITEPCSWPAAAPDAGAQPPCLIHGGGTYTHLLIVNGQPAVSFAQSPDSVNESTGAWFALRTGANSWTRSHVSAAAGRPGHGPSLAYSATGGFALGLFAADQGDLLVATSPDGIAWNVNTVEALGETGYHPALAFGKAGLGVIYAYCRAPLDPAGQCNPSVQELRFRLPGSNGPSGVWQDPEHVDGAVPEATALIADGNGNYLAVWRDPTLGLRASRRSP